MKILIDFEFSADGEGDLKQQLADFIEEELGEYGTAKVLSIAEETQDIGDGYHSFKELYDHRIQLFIVLANWYQEFVNEYSRPLEDDAWKSKKHSDGSEWEGWFIAGIKTKAGEQLSYHLPIEKWGDLKVPELDTAPEWDGHTPQDVIERLKSL